MKSSFSQTPVGVLVTNLGTPEAPTPKALKKYLKEFLSDPRVVDAPRFFWWFVLRFVILRKRPEVSAKLYQKIWTDNGSPLLFITQNIAKKMSEKFKEGGNDSCVVAVGMRYGEPSLKKAVDELLQKGSQKILVLPLYPQYSFATTASTKDKIQKVLKKNPELKWEMISHYYDEPFYLEALTKKIKSFWQNEEKPEKLLFSFHGLPEKSKSQGDPYYKQCEATSYEIAKRLGLKREDWLFCFQSRFGKEEWLKPYTDQTLQHLASDGVKSVQVVCPGFAADCLETLEEIAQTNQKIFLKAGGEKYSYIPALNDDDEHVSALVEIIKKKIQGSV